MVLSDETLSNKLMWIPNITLIVAIAVVLPFGDYTQLPMVFVMSGLIALAITLVWVLVLVLISMVLKIRYIFSCQVLASSHRCNDHGALFIARDT